MSFGGRVDGTMKLIYSRCIYDYDKVREDVMMIAIRRVPRENTC